MDQAEGLSVLLNDAEPATVVRRRRRLVNSGSPLLLNDLSNFVENTARNRALAKNPWNVRYVGNLDRIEVLGVKGSSLVVRPGKRGVMRADNPLGELDLFRIEEILSERHLIASFSSESAGWNEDRRMGGKGRHSSKRIRMISTNDSEVLRKGRRNRSHFVRDLLVDERLDERILSELLRQPNSCHLERRVWVRWGWRQTVAKVQELRVERLSRDRIWKV
jgi:hypothetical protein